MVVPIEGDGYEYRGYDENDARYDDYTGWERNDESIHDDTDVLAVNKGTGKGPLSYNSGEHGNVARVGKKLAKSKEREPRKAKEKASKVTAWDALAASSVDGKCPSPNFAPMAKRDCYRCGEPDHIARDCPKKKGANEGNGLVTRGSASGSNGQVHGRRI